VSSAGANGDREGSAKEKHSVTCSIDKCTLLAKVSIVTNSDSGISKRPKLKSRKATKLVPG
jgi:hypothetical protein